MKVLVDSREQRALEFTHPYLTEVIVTVLTVGDYGIQFEDGHIPSVFFERKSVSDLFGTLGKGYERFKREIVRAQENNMTLVIIIEGTFTKIFNGAKYSTLEGISIIRKLFTLWIRHGIQFVFCKDREEMSQYIIEFFYCLGKEYIRRKKNELKPNRQTVDGCGVDRVYEEIEGHEGGNC